MCQQLFFCVPTLNIFSLQVFARSHFFVAIPSVVMLGALKHIFNPLCWSAHLKKGKQQKMCHSPNTLFGFLFPPVPQKDISYSSPAENPLKLHLNQRCTLKTQNELLILKGLAAL